MGIFSRKPLICPVCNQEVPIGAADRTGFGHFATHLDDDGDRRDQLVFACGCPDAVFPITGNWTNDVMKHLRFRHGLKVIVV